MDFEQQGVPGVAGTGRQIEEGPRSGLLLRVHQRATDSFARRALVFVGLFLLLTVLLFGFEIPHLGYNARLHWDAETSLYTLQSTPGREVLAEARRHVFDILTVGHVTDPVKATELFNAGDPRFDHNSLEIVRSYYSQVSFGVSRFVLDKVASWTGSPVDAVLAFQCTALVAMAFSLSLLLTYCIATIPAGPDLRRRLRLFALAAAVIVTCPVILSLSRQLLTETVAFTWLIPSLMLLIWSLNPRRSTPAAAAMLAIAASGLLLTVRTRYSLGPAMVLLLPLFVFGAIPVSALRRQWKHYLFAIGSSFVVLAVLIGVDIHSYGPMIFPWIYNDMLVRSTRYFFHATPPYGLFFLMLYVNFPMVLLPLLTIGALVRRVPVQAGAVDVKQQRWVRWYAIVAFVAFVVLIWQMAMQQVGFQGRHLFALSGGCTLLMLLTIGRVRWSPIGRRLFIGFCVFFLVMNLLSDFWFQRTAPLGPGRAPADFSFAQRLSSGAHPWTARLVFARIVVAMSAYYDGADDSRIHDGLIAAEYLHRQTTPGKRPLLVTDTSPDDGRWWAGHFATQFDIADVTPMGARFDPAVIGPIRAAIAAGRPVYLFTASRRPVVAIVHVEPMRTEPLRTAAMYRVTTVDNAGYRAAVGVNSDSTHDEIRITAKNISGSRCPSGYWQYIDQISPEDMWRFTDPSGPQIAFEINGLQPGHRYELSTVTWNREEPNGSMLVRVGKTNQTMEIRNTDRPLVSTMPLTVTDRAPLVVSLEGPSPGVCEIWVRELP